MARHASRSGAALGGNHSRAIVLVSTVPQNNYRTWHHNLRFAGGLQCEHSRCGDDKLHKHFFEVVPAPNSNPNAYGYGSTGYLVVLRREESGTAPTDIDALEKHSFSTCGLVKAAQDGFCFIPNYGTIGIGRVLPANVIVTL